MRRFVMASSFASLVTTLAACTAQAPSAPPPAAAPATDPAVRTLEQQIAQFAPTDLTADISRVARQRARGAGRTW